MSSTTLQWMIWAFLMFLSTGLTLVGAFAMSAGAQKLHANPTVMQACIAYPTSRSEAPRHKQVGFEARASVRDVPNRQSACDSGAIKHQVGHVIIVIDKLFLTSCN